MIQEYWWWKRTIACGEGLLVVDKDHCGGGKWKIWKMENIGKWKILSFFDFIRIYQNPIGTISQFFLLLLTNPQWNIWFRHVFQKKFQKSIKKYGFSKKRAPKKSQRMLLYGKTNIFLCLRRCRRRKKVSKNSDLGKNVFLKNVKIVKKTTFFHVIRICQNPIGTVSPLFCLY